MHCGIYNGSCSFFQHLQFVKQQQTVEGKITDASPAYWLTFMSTFAIYIGREVCRTKAGRKTTEF